MHIFCWLLIVPRVHVRLEQDRAPRAQIPQGCFRLEYSGDVGEVFDDDGQAAAELAVDLPVRVALAVVAGGNLQGQRRHRTRLTYQ